MEIKKLKDGSLSGMTRNNAVFFAGICSAPDFELRISISSAAQILLIAGVSHNRNIAFTIKITQLTVSWASIFPFSFR